MRIAFTGSHGTGKTTLVDLIEADGSLGKVVRPPSTARMAMQFGLAGNRDATPFSQVMMLVSNINKEYMVDPSSELIISDRTPIDNLAYTFYQLREVWKDLDPTTANYYWTQLLMLGMSNIAGYDHIFYFPPYFAPEDDGIRDDDRQYQLDVDLLIKKLIDENNIPVEIVPDTSPEERLEWLKEVVLNADL